MWWKMECPIKERPARRASARPWQMQPPRWHARHAVGASIRCDDGLSPAPFAGGHAPSQGCVPLNERTCGKVRECSSARPDRRETGNATTDSRVSGTPQRLCEARQGHVYFIMPEIRQGKSSRRGQMISEKAPPFHPCAGAAAISPLNDGLPPRKSPSLPGLPTLMKKTHHTVCEAPHHKMPGFKVP